MSLKTRVAGDDEFDRVFDLLVESFEPVSYWKTIDERYGPLNGKDWRERWRGTLGEIQEKETLIVGEVENRLVAFATRKVDPETRLGDISVVAVRSGIRGRRTGISLHASVLDRTESIGGISGLMVSFN